MFYKLLLFLLYIVLCKAGDQFEDDCGLEAVASKPFVRGGLGNVKANQFPWHVAIFHRNKDNQFEQICGGSLVRSNLVISAAHCFSDRAHSHQVHVEDYRVVAGVRLSSWNSTEIGRQQSEVREVSLGEKYGASYLNFQDDISIIHLTTRFTISDTVRAVCLDLTDVDLYTNQTSPGSLGKVAGWGLTEWGAFSVSLNFLGVPVVARVQCFDKLPPFFKSYFTSDKICAGLTNGTAVCQGDSGGGLVFPQNTSAGPQRWFLRGVLSNAPVSRNLSDPCVSNFALYTNIYSHQMWLTTQMNDNLPRDGCRVRGSAGLCREFSACPRATAEAASGILPQFCSPSKICCVMTCPPLPPSTFSQQKTGSKAKDYCLDLAERLYPCQQNGSSWSMGDLCGPEPEKHVPQYLVVPLTKTSPSEIQRYGFVPTGGVEVFLVSERWLLTRASQWDMLLKYLTWDITPSPEVVFTFNRTVHHPQYVPWNTTFYGSPATNDIFLLEMDRPVAFSRSYRPVCLHTPQDSVAVEGLALTRWDYRSYRHPVTPLPQEECSRKFPPGSRAVPGGATDSHLCVTFSSSSVWSCKPHKSPNCYLLEPVRLWHPQLEYVVKLKGFTSYLTANNGHRVVCAQLLVGLFLDHKQEDSTCTVLYHRLSPYIPWVESVVWP